jgi:hypothetical protein
MMRPSIANVLGHQIPLCDAQIFGATQNPRAARKLRGALNAAFASASKRMEFVYADTAALG